MELGESEVSEIRRLYKQAGLNLEEGIASSEESWWLNAEPIGSSWSQVERLLNSRTLFQHQKKFKILQGPC